VVSSGLFFRGYCQALSSHIQATMQTEKLRLHLREMSQVALDDTPSVFKLDKGSPISEVFPGREGDVIVYGTNKVSVYWRVFGGAFGIVSAASPPVPRFWLEENCKLTEGLWVVLRGG
jgi:hypothetical protein